MHKALSRLDDSYRAFDPRSMLDAHERFLQRHAEGGVYEINGLEFTCPPDIYQPHEFGSTRFMLRGLFADAPESLGHRVLEMGAGSGAVGICLAAAGCDVTLADIDPVAVTCCRDNARANRVSATILESDLFAGLAGQRFDAILFNAPLMDKAIEHPLEIISCDPGGALLSRFLREAPNFLAAGGRVIVIVANFGNKAAILKALDGYEDTILFAEYHGRTEGWRWLVSLKPLPDPVRGATVS